MGDTIHVDFSKDEQKKTLKTKIKEMYVKGKYWLLGNKELVITYAPIVIAGITTLVNIADRRKKLRREEPIRTLCFYDRSLDLYWALQREPSNREWSEIDNRIKCGEKIGDILMDLKLLR